VVLSAVDSRALWEQEAVDVLAVDLDLRECADPEAERQIETVARQLCTVSKDARVLLKIDSTLRGPIAGLVAGAQRGSGKDIAVIAPAFPEQGRLMHEGRVVVVDGRAGASLTLALGMEGTALVGARFVSSAQEVEQAVEHARMRGARRVVVDTDTARCLHSVAGAWQQHPEWLLVGSGGLTRQVAGPGDPPPTFDVPSANGPILIVAGSPAPMTRAQIDRLGTTASVSVVGAQGQAPPMPQEPGAVLVLCTPPASERDAGESAAAVAATVAEWAKTLRPGAVVLAGGATARRVCERLGALGLRLAGELSPGVPIGRMVGGVWDDVLVVTKAGGFGTPTTLLDVVRALGVLSLQQP
jgi:uncharacterized protein YgbK (DUF1537 family)